MKAAQVKIVAGEDKGLSLSLSPETSCRIGRSPEADLTLSDPSISRFHLSLTFEGGRLVLRDLGSSYGVFLGEEKVKEAEVRDGDRILIGDTLLEVNLPPQVDLPHIEGYRLLGLLGQGGMGAVYHGRRTSDDMEVAIKVIKFEEEPPPSMIKMFHREAQTASSIEHKNAVRTEAIREAGGMHFIEMEFVRGHSVSDYLAKKGRLSLKSALRIAAQVAEVLVEAAEKNIVHRDIKPENILVTDGGMVKVCDFGLAKVLDETGLSQLTRTGMIKGTVNYMSPEQIDDAKSARETTDQYGLGATLYHMLCGQPRLFGGTLRDRMIRICMEDVDPPSQHCDNIPPDVEEAIMTMLHRIPRERYATPAKARDVLQALAKKYR